MVTPSKRKNILVVENDEGIRESVAEVLTLEGYTVALASNGQEGLNQLAQAPLPCLILVDVLMPVMDGREFLARLKADPALQGCKVAIFTAREMPPPQGTVGLLRKPFELSELLDLVNRHCP